MTYWGNLGAGIIFFHQNEILLTLRSEYVQEPLTWGLPGGSIQGEHYTNEEEIKSSQLSILDKWKGAKREAKEELGCIPKNLDYFDYIVYKDKNFEFTTFLVEITEPQKTNWQFSIDRFEVREAAWFLLNNLPSPLHFGISFAIKQKPFYFRDESI